MLNQDEQVIETLNLQTPQNQILTYLDTTYSIIQILQSTGWYLKDGVWIKGEGAVVNKKGFLEIRRILFSTLHPGNQLSFMWENTIENHICSIMKAISIQFALHLKEYGIPDTETYHTLMAQIRLNLHFHLMKSVKAKMLNSLTQQIQTIYQIQGEMESKKEGVIGKAINRILGKKGGNQNETIPPI